MKFIVPVLSEKQLAASFSQPEPTPTHTIQEVYENPQDQSKVTIALDVADILVEIRQAIRAKNYSDQLIELYAKEQSPALERLLLWSILRSKLTEPQLDLLNHIIQQQQRFKRKLIRADFQPLKQKFSEDHVFTVCSPLAAGNARQRYFIIFRC